MNKKLIFSLIAIALCSGLAGKSHALQSSPTVRQISVDAIQLESQKFKNKYATVFYVSASPNLIDTSGSRLIVNTILGTPQKVQLNESGSTLVPETKIPRVNGRAFNYIVIAVHEQPNVFLRSVQDEQQHKAVSVDGDPRATGALLKEESFKYLLIRQVDRPLNPGAITVDLDN